MKFYIFWSCGWTEDGSGIEEFATKEAAIAWLNKQPSEHLARVMIIQGYERKLRAVEVVKTFDIEV